MSRNDDHTAIAMMTGDTIQRRLTNVEGEVIRKVPEDQLLSTLKDELDHWEA